MKKIRSFISIVLALSLLIGLIPSGAFAAPESRRVPFSDVKSTDWFYEPVEYAYENGLMTGTGSSTFSPNLTTTRGMIVTILHRMEGEPDASRAAFNDVPRSRYYAEAIDWASANGIVSGYGSNRFGPDDPITREQMASIMYRYSEYKGYDTSASASLNRFKDGSSVSNYAKNVMRWAVGSGLLSGRTADTLAPQGQTTRAEAATILMRYCETIAAASEETFTVTFDSAGGSHVASQEVKSGGQAKEPADPTRDGYTFAGWQLKGSFGTYNFDASIFADITLVAQWEADDFEAAHEEFMEKDIYDFDLDRVLQVDENDTEDNFVVVADDVDLIKDDTVSNQVSSANEEAGVYVLSNITDEVRNLQPDDKLMIVSDSDVDNNIAVTVGSISINGNNATITSSGASLEDFYVYMQINEEVEVEEENMIEDGPASNPEQDNETELGGLQAEPMIPVLVGSGLAFNETASKVYRHEVEYPEKSGEDAMIDGATEMALSITVVAEWDLDLLGEDYLRCDVIANMALTNDYEVNFVDIKDDIIWPLFPVKLPIGATGLIVEGQVNLIVSYSGQIYAELDSAYSKNIGFRYNTEDGFKSVNETEENDISAIVTAKASVGAGIGADLTLSFATVLNGTIGGEVGVRTDVLGEKDLLATDQTHRCFLCFDGDIFLYGKCTGRLDATIFGFKKEFFNKELFSGEALVDEFYCSLLNEGGAYSFGWGECPYKNAGPVEEEKPPAEEETPPMEEPGLEKIWNQYLATTNETGIYFIQADYDGNGTEEGFGFTGEFDGREAYNHVKMYFISSQGNVSLYDDNLWGYLRAYNVNDYVGEKSNYLVDTGVNRFIVWELFAYGSGSSSVIVGVRDGDVYEPNISRNYMTFEQEGVGKYTAVTSDFSQGYHDWIPHEFEFDYSTGEFRLVK